MSITRTITYKYRNRQRIWDLVVPDSKSKDITLVLKDGVEMDHFATSALAREIATVYDKKEGADARYSSMKVKVRK